VLHHEKREASDALEGAGEAVSDSELAGDVAALMSAGVYKAGVDVTSAWVQPVLNWRGAPRTELVSGSKTTLYEMHDVAFKFRSRKLGSDTPQGSAAAPLEQAATAAAAAAASAARGAEGAGRGPPNQGQGGRAGKAWERQMCALERGRPWRQLCGALTWRTRTEAQGPQLQAPPGELRPRGAPGAPRKPRRRAQSSAAAEAAAQSWEATPRTLLALAPPRGCCPTLRAQEIAVAGPRGESETRRALRPLLWVTQDFPLQLSELLPLLDLLANRVKAVQRLKDLLTTQLPPGTVPVKVAVPLVPTIRVQATFSRFVEYCAPSEGSSCGTERGRTPWPGVETAVALLCAQAPLRKRQGAPAALLPSPAAGVLLGRGKGPRREQGRRLSSGGGRRGLLSPPLPPQLTWEGLGWGRRRGQGGLGRGVGAGTRCAGLGAKGRRLGESGGQGPGGPGCVAGCTSGEEEFHTSRQSGARSGSGQGSRPPSGVPTPRTFRTPRPPPPWAAHGAPAGGSSPAAPASSSTSWFSWARGTRSSKGQQGSPGDARPEPGAGCP